ncbi:MAG: hypothetical protein ABIJ21_05710 [Nanoarchaeota archaeon]
MNKKGSDPNYTWPELVLAGVLVFGIMFGVVYKIANPHKINQEYIAKDSAIIIDTLYGTPRNAQVGIRYPHAFAQYHLVAKNNLVQVGSVGDAMNDRTARYPYSHHQEYALLDADFLFLSLDFFKDRTAVSFTPKQGVVIGQLPVEDVDTNANMDDVRIFVFESPDTKAVGDLLSQILLAESRSSRTATIDNADVIIYLTKGTENTLKVYYSDIDASMTRKSRKLATLIHNEFSLKDGVFDSFVIQPPETHENAFAIFRKALPVVYVELGTVEKPATLYSESISVALRRYFA